MVCILGPLTQWQSASRGNLSSHNCAKLCKNHTIPAEGYQTLMVLKHEFHQQGRWSLFLSSSLSNSTAAACEQQHGLQTLTKNSAGVSLQISVTECSISSKPPHSHVHHTKPWHTQLFNCFQSMVCFTLYINFSFLFLSPAFAWVMASLSWQGNAVPSNGLCAPGNQRARKSPG